MSLYYIKIICMVFIIFKMLQNHVFEKIIFVKFLYLNVFVKILLISVYMKYIRTISTKLRYRVLIIDIT